MKRSLPLLLILSGCGAVASDLTPAPAASHTATDGIPRTRPDVDLSPAKAAEIQSLFDAVRTVLMSADFKRNMDFAASGIDLRLEPAGAAISPAELANMLSGEAEGFTYAPAEVDWRLLGGSVTNIESRGPEILLKRAVRGWWRSPSAAAKSCAINSAAHELTHTLGRGAGEFDQAITDRGYEKQPKTQHFASYTAGSVAQCTWLEQQGELVGTIAACVALNGTRGFHPSDC